MLVDNPNSMHVRGCHFQHNCFQRALHCARFRRDALVLQISNTLFKKQADVLLFA